MGFMDLWFNWFEPELRQCVVDQQNLFLTNRKKRLNVRLTLSNMTGVFAILVGGYMLAILAFLVEAVLSLIVSFSQNNQRQIRQQSC